MPTMRVELPVRVSHSDLDALQQELGPYGSAYEEATESMDWGAYAVILSLFFEAAQGIDVLAKWLVAVYDRNPRVNRATIRLSDGSTFHVNTTNEEALRRALKSALKEM